MRRIVLAAPALPFVALPSGAEANVLVRVDRATQIMNASVDGAPVYQAGLDRPAWVRSAGPHVPSAAHGGALVLDGLL